MLRDNLHGEMMLENVDIGICLHFLHERELDLRAGVVGMVENPEFGVSAFAVKIERAVFFPVEIHAPAEELIDLRGRVPDHFLHSPAVGEPVAGHHGVVDMFVEIIYLEIGDTRHAPLGEISVGFIKGSLAYHSHPVCGRRHFQGEAHSGDARTYHQIVVFEHHFLTCF